MGFKYYVQADKYIIEVCKAVPYLRENPADRFSIYEWKDRALFLRVFSDAMQAYFAQATWLSGRVNDDPKNARESASMEVGMRREWNNKVESGEPIPSWLAEAEQLQKAPFQIKT